MTGGRDNAATIAGVKALLTSGVVTACFYAERPQDRPCCEGLGLVRYGPITLCADCDRRRSAVGKGMAPLPLADPGALLEVIAARDACRQAELALRCAVSSARRAGHAWSALGAVLGTTRQAAQQRFDQPVANRLTPDQKEVINRS
ncbi:MAG TPA: hypothetical protein VMU90_13365 [Solirubrobacteraceae bacterium]|nr:hypothetical protein [Solirubrobacteraceae bacterium]HVA09689.1 hypothetical protein [Acidimicrobiales bacterium]